MISKKQVVALIFLPAIILPLASCNMQSGWFGKGAKSDPAKVVDIEKTPADQEKAKLLKKIDRRFENPNAHFRLGQMYHADGLYTQAEYEYNVALSFDPAHRPAQAAMVKVLLENNRISKSEIYSDIYMNQAASSAAESLKLGLAFQRQRMDEYALACYRQSLSMAPNSAKVNRQIGYYYLSKGDREIAKGYLKRSFDLNRNQPNIAGELGRLGVAIRVPRKTERNTAKLDKIVDRSDKDVRP